MFSDECFDEVYYGITHPVSYHDFAEAKHDEGESQPNAQAKRHGTRVRLRILRRERDEGATLLLNWLEQGVFEALQKCVLRAMQVNLIADKNRPTEILESYTFSFTYAASSSDNNILSGVTFKGLKGEAVSLKSVKHSLHDFMRQMITLCETLPKLTGKQTACRARDPALGLLTCLSPSLPFLEPLLHRRLPAILPASLLR